MQELEPLSIDKEEQALLGALRAGDEQAFVTLVERYHAPMVRLASAFVGSRATAEDVAQEAWLGVLRGLNKFEGRSSLRTWIFRILTNRAKTRGSREGRVVPFSDLWQIEDEEQEPAMAPDRFISDGNATGHWISSLQPWPDLPEDQLLAQEIRQVVEQAIETLPASQRTVISLRDIEGWPSEEVRNILGISESNQRVLLHRARARVRQALEPYLAAESV